MSISFFRELIHSIEQTISHILTLPLVHTVLISGLFLVGLCGLFLLGLSLYIVETLIRPKRKAPSIDLHALMLNLPFEEISFPVDHHQVRGIYLSQPDSTTTIITCPGYRRSYADVLAVCTPLWEAGHAVLAFEFWGHGAVVGSPVTLGFREIRDMLGAVAYIKERTPHTRIGVLAYSMGGAVAIMARACTREIEAVVADSAFATHWRAVEYAIHRTLRFSHALPAWMMRIVRWTTDPLLWVRAGYHFHQVEPVRAIAATGCPILLIHGENDTVVKRVDAQMLYEAAHEPKRLWLWPGADHVRAYSMDKRAYIEGVTTFFERHLKQSIQAHSFKQTSSETDGGRRTNDPSPLVNHRNISPTAAFGKRIFQFRWAIVALWMLVFLAAVPFASRVTTVLTNSGYNVAGSASMNVNTILMDTLHQPITHLFVVLHADHTLLTNATYQREIREAASRSKQLAHISMVTQGGPGLDGRTTYITLGLNEDSDTVAQQVPLLRQHLNIQGPARISLTGDPAVANDVELATQTDTERAERIAIPITLLVLLLVFGSISAALMPLLLAIVAVVTALAIVYGIACALPTNIFSYNIVSVIGLGLSIDYSLFVVRRFREELAQGLSTGDAIAITVATAGEAILFSATIVVIGFSGLLLIGVEIMSSFALGGMVVASVAALAALTLLPAVLSILGSRINVLRVPLCWPRPSPSRLDERNFWQRWATFVLRKPIAIIVLVLVSLAFLGWPAKGLNPGITGASALPSTSESRQGLVLLSTQYPQANLDPLILVARTADGSSVLSPQNLQHIALLTQWIAHHAHATHVVSLMQPPQTSGTPTRTRTQLLQLYSSGRYLQIPVLAQFVHSMVSGDTTIVSFESSALSGSKQDQALIDQIRGANKAKAGLATELGGSRAIDLDFMRVLYTNFWGRTLPFLLIMTFLLLLAMFRSVLLPLKAIAMNVLSISASYGALVWIFQDGNFQTQLGFTANGIIDRFIPPLLFCILFGLSMDYEVFLLSRVREEWLHTHDNQQAIILGVEKTGSIISNAAILFMIIAGAFISTSLIVSKQLGVGILISLAVDSTIIRLLLVPATMQVMGRWNWWFPTRLRFSHVTVCANTPISALGRSLHLRAALASSSTMQLQTGKHSTQSLEDITQGGQMINAPLYSNGPAQTKAVKREKNSTSPFEESMHLSSAEQDAHSLSSAFSGPSSFPGKRQNGKTLTLVASLVSLLALVSATIVTVLFLDPSPRSTSTSHTTPLTIPEAQVGTLAFLSSGQLNPSSSQGLNDQISLNLEHLIPPTQGHAYYAWLLPDTTDDETKPLLLGTLSASQGRIAHLNYTSPIHANLLATYSRFRITEQEKSSVPMIPSPDPSTWRYVGEISNTPTPGDEKGYSLLSHLRHLLAKDPTLQSIGLNGGLDIWLYRNSEKLVEYSTAMRDDWPSKGAANLIRPQIVRVLDYLYGSVYAWQEVSPGTPFLIDARAGRLGLLEISPTQDPPGYLAHVDLHLQGLANSPGHTAGQHDLAIQIARSLAKVTAHMKNISNDAVHLMRMSTPQLHQQHALDFIDDIVTNANAAYVGLPDPVTGENIGGVTSIYARIEGLATMPITTPTKGNQESDTLTRLYQR